ncbi:hypothetical protein L249_8697 [Ophiocordyceps polyrhachis-furcata BCC 54312]|uniref:Nephrocystin 3-like N-terminal domain-containing protein n=1 Tax=Ophiocordyceps polyrhachis-furcata BCC 54312 TaxID=1330021 RepID=A0A367L6G5_9HYPO|nr:hypothetical protein L249_8697 [Ophiocordyceps polyrhachis-furcata BCC 54312]
MVLFLLSSSMFGSSQRFHLHSPAVDFVETRLHRYHKAFDNSQVRYDPAVDRFVDAMDLSLRQSQLLHPDSSPRPLPPKIEVMKFWGGIFPKAMSCLNDQPALRNSSHPEYGIRHLGTWEEVHDRLCRAKSSYEFSKKKSGTGARAMEKWRKGVRIGMDHAVHPLQQVTKMMPTNDVASPVVGGIKVLLEAYKRAADFRREIDTEFDDLSDAFVDIEFNVTRFPGDENIIAASEKLLLAILKAIEHTICFYTAYQLVRGLAAVGCGDRYQQPLRDCLAEIKSCKELLDRQSHMSESYSHDRSQQSDREFNMYMVHAINKMFSLLQERQNHPPPMELWNHHLPLAGHLPFQELRHQPHLPSSQSQTMAFHASTYLHEQSRTPQLQKKHEILDISSFDEDDIQYVLSRAGAMAAEDRGRAEQMVDSRLFTSWVLNRQTSKLLIHGDFDSADDISPLSVLCATIVQAIRSRVGYISLVYFCGLHQYKKGPVSMIRSLIEQLLRHCLVPPGTMDRIAQGNVAELCQLFGELARSLPSHLTIFCFIDGIQIYERSQYRDGMEEVICSILAVAEDGEPGRSAPIKMLLTSPRATIHVQKLFDIDSSLLTMAAIPHTGQSPSSLRLNRQLGGIVPED